MAPGEAELRLRARLAKLRNLQLPGGSRLSGELEKLERQLERMQAEPTGDDIWRSVGLARLRVPAVAAIIGEGGSGGAIALALADRVLMQENAVYSVITPEGCAMILWRDVTAAQKAAAAFKPDAAHCFELGVVDAIVPEPPGGAQGDHDGAARLLAESFRETLDELVSVPGDELRRERRRKFRAMGVFVPV